MKSWHNSCPVGPPRRLKAIAGQDLVHTYEQMGGVPLLREMPREVAEEARHLMSLKNGAPGSDNRGCKDLRELSTVSLACRFNLWLLTGKAPGAVKHCTMVLIPKTPDGALQAVP